MGLNYEDFWLTEEELAQLEAEEEARKSWTEDQWLAYETEGGDAINVNDWVLDAAPYVGGYISNDLTSYAARDYTGEEAYRLHRPPRWW